MDEHVPTLNLFFTPEFGDPIWAGIDYELEVPGPSKGEWVLGRSPTAAITINLRTVSGKHAVISYSYANDAWMISDLGSENGTFVNGKKVEPPRRPRAIEIGDKIDLGPRARILVVERQQDTIPEDLGPPTIASTTPIEVQHSPPPPAPPPPPPPPATAKTLWDSLYLGTQWLISASTPQGTVYRLIVGAAAGAFFIFVVDWLRS